MCRCGCDDWYALRCALLGADRNGRPLVARSRIMAKMHHLPSLSSWQRWEGKHRDPKGRYRHTCPSDRTLEDLRQALARVILGDRRIQEYLKASQFPYPWPEDLQRTPTLASR